MMSVKQLTNIILLVTAMLVAPGCAVHPLNYAPEQIARQVEVSGVEFDKKIKYTGPTIQSTGERSSPQDIHLTRLYAEWSRATDEVSYYVLADVLYPSGLRYYRRATFDDTSSASVKTLWSADNPCTGSNCYKSYSVRFPVELSRLLNRPTLDFRLKSISGETNAFSIPRAHIEGFVIATQQPRKYRDTLGSKRPLRPLFALDQS